MADHPVERLGGKTLLEYARPEYMNRLAKMGRTGRLQTIPSGFAPGSEVANTSILGYDLNKVYEGRGPLLLSDMNCIPMTWRYGATSSRWRMGISSHTMAETLKRLMQMC